MFSKLRRLLALASALLVVAAAAHAAAEAPRYIAAGVDGVVIDMPGEANDDAPPPTDAPEGFQHEAPGGAEHAFVATDDVAPWGMGSIRSDARETVSPIIPGLTAGTHDRPPRTRRA